MITQHSLTDNYSLDDGANIRLTRDGYLTANVRIARTGIQTYTAAELGLTDRASNTPVSVYRPPEEVFHVDAMRSMSHRPITDGHPSVPVTADNWSSLAKGDTGDEVMRDGDFVRVPIKLMDQKTIDKVTDGKRELSVGYTCDLEFIDGTTEDGHKYDAVQRNIRGNHLAICDRARGGKALAIIDERRMTPEPTDGDRPMAEVKMVVDGVPFNVADATAEAVVAKVVTARDAAVTRAEAAEGKAAEQATQIQAKDAEIATLTQSVKDAAVTPAQIRAAAANLTKTLGDAKRLSPALTFADTMGEDEIKSAVVKGRMGDAAKDWTPAQIDASFAIMAKDGATGPDGVAKVIGDGLNVVDAKAGYAKARAARLAHLNGEPAETVN